MFEISRIIEDYRRFYFSPVIMFAIEVLVIGILFRSKKKGLVANLFKIYVIADIIIYLSDDIALGYSGMHSSFYNSYLTFTNSLVTLIEISIYYIFFSRVFKKKMVNYFLLISWGVIACMTAILLIPDMNFITPSYRYSGRLLYAIELVLLLPFCGLYFWNVFRFPTSIKLVDRPSFWISTGVFVYACISIPNLLIGGKILESSFYGVISALLFYLPLIINFCCIAKAFKCKHEFNSGTLI